MSKVDSRRVDQTQGKGRTPRRDIIERVVKEYSGLTAHALVPLVYGVGYSPNGNAYQVFKGAARSGRVRAVHEGHVTRYYPVRPSRSRHSVE
jgi:hypothetical protein